MQSENWETAICTKIHQGNRQNVENEAKNESSEAFIINHDENLKSLNNESNVTL